MDQPPLVISGSVDAETQSSNASIATSLPLDIIKGPLVTSAKLYILGDKYDIPSFKNLASYKYKDIVKDRWNHDTFAESDKIIYENIVRDEDVLKDVIIKAAHANMSQLLDRGEFVNLHKNSNDMTFDVLAAMLNKNSRPCRNYSGFQYTVCKHCVRV
ncbi:hypothetical protein BGZ60DRAFT_534153 [Tricladium varicosporioides]|nr:hypothetical protein BGZ60DRAFT_534153 [Hymenoscyphus varicosporioides]